jgi:hypothetical protein
MSDGDRDARTAFPIGAILVGWLCLGATNGEAKADQITLRGGGQLKGKLIPDKAHPDQWLLLAEVGKTPMVLKKEQVVQVTPEKSALDDYVVLREKDRSTAEAEYQLGVWCEEHNLKDLAQVHYKRTVELDGYFEAAQRKLGHVRMDGRWLNADEVKEAQGFVKYKGRWVTPEEKERREMLAASAAEGSAWVKRLKTIRDAYLSGPVERSREAERRLLDINQPIAIGPVLQVLGEDPTPALRAIASQILGGIPGPQAANGLVGRFLQEEDPNVCRMTLDQMARRESSEIVPLLTRSLRSSHHEVVNRSAWGLSSLNAVATVPRLVSALITVEYQVVMVDSGSGGTGLSYNSTTPAQGYGNSQGRSIAVLTPPVVGPGVVAYGATSVPLGAAGGTSFGMGSGGSRGPIPRLVPIEYRNDEVLAALIKMTGRDFGYDVSTWKQWVASSFKLDSPPTRRVPQP